MKRIAVLCIGLSLIVFAGCMAKPVDQGTSDITPPTKNKDIQEFFNYLEETIKKEEVADKAAIEEAKAEESANTEAQVILDDLEEQAE